MSQRWALSPRQKGHRRVSWCARGRRVSAAGEGPGGFLASAASGPAWARTDSRTDSSRAGATRGWRVRRRARPAVAGPGKGRGRRGGHEPGSRVPQGCGGQDPPASCCLPSSELVGLAPAGHSRRSRGSVSRGRRWPRDREPEGQTGGARPRQTPVCIETQYVPHSSFTPQRVREKGGGPRERGGPEVAGRRARGRLVRGADPAVRPRALGVSAKRCRVQELFVPVVGMLLSNCLLRTNSPLSEACLNDSGTLILLGRVAPCRTSEIGLIFQVYIVAAHHSNLNQPKSRFRRSLEGFWVAPSRARAGAGRASGSRVPPALKACVMFPL